MVIVHTLCKDAVLIFFLVRRCVHTNRFRIYLSSSRYQRDLILLFSRYKTLFKALKTYVNSIYIAGMFVGKWSKKGK